MKNYFKILLIAFSILTFGCSSDDGGNNPGDGGGGLVAQATYRVTFTPNFTAQTHPTDYPSDAGFSKMFLMAHSNSTTLFSLGGIASPGLREMATTGETATLVQEHTPSEDNVNPTTIIIGNDISATGTYETTINLTPNTTYISLASMIQPSPDWFVGVDALDMVNADNSLVDFIEISLFPIDAGADAGTTYTSPDDPENSNIAGIGGVPFVGTGGFVQRLGSITIERIDIN